MKLPVLTPEMMSVKGQELLDVIKSDFIGLETEYKIESVFCRENVFLAQNVLLVGIASDRDSFQKI